MKSLSFALALGAIASLAVVPAGHAVTCPDRAPGVINAPGTAVSRSCQSAIAKAGLKFAKAQIKIDAKCMSKQVPGACPNAKDTAKIQKAALKGRDAIVKACDDAGALSGLLSSYNAVADPADVASCMLSQHNVEGRLLTFVVNGTPGVVYQDKARDKCVKTLNKAGVKYALGAMQTINGCIAKAMKGGTTSNLHTLCAGGWSGGAFTPPGDVKTADKLAGLLGKLESSIDKACGPLHPALFPSIYACPGATTIADYQNCVACQSWDTTVDLLEQQHNETGTLVTNGPGALQAAVTAASVDDKLLIQSGLYAEEVTIATDGLQLVGCGGASGDRPRIDPPTTGGPYSNGIDAGSIDGLLFQSLDLGPWPDNGIFVAQADGVGFRDVVSDSEDISLYAVFPVTSNDVLVELCDVRRVRDAGIYVGQSTNIVVRYNSVIENVAGLEIENSDSAFVHNNYASGNTGGILIFKLPGLPVQLSNNHEVAYNVSIDNNRPNIGSGTVGTIPDGTGILVLSNDDGDFHHNILLRNNSFGFVLVDQQVINFLASPGPPPFPTTSPDQKATGNMFYENLVPGLDFENPDNGANGTSPDNTPPNTTQGVGGPIVYAVFEEDPAPNYNNNCFEGNTEPVIDNISGTALTNCP